MAIFTDEKGKKVKTTHFGAAGMSDYTNMKIKREKRDILLDIRREKIGMII